MIVTESQALSRSILYYSNEECSLKQGMKQQQRKTAGVNMNETKYYPLSLECYTHPELNTSVLVQIFRFAILENFMHACKRSDYDVEQVINKLIRYASTYSGKTKAAKIGTLEECLLHISQESLQSLDLA